MKRFMEEKEVSRLTSVSLQTLRNWRHLRKGFPYVKMGRKVLYDWDDIVSDLEARKIFPERGVEDV